MASPLPRRTSVKAPKRHKAQNRAAAKQSNALSLSVADKRQAALELRIAGHAIADIATALHLSPGRISQLIGEVLVSKNHAISAMAETLRAMELERIDRMIVSWYIRATNEPAAANTLLHWVDRRIKLLGLEAMGREPTAIRVTASSLDLSKLNEQELQSLEKIIEKSGPRVLD